MPVLNTPANWLQDAWLSICGQASMGIGSWELVVVDDCSESEETIRILCEWERLPQVHVVRLERHSGIARALNVGWTYCRGSFVARLDSDDIAHECRLLHQLTYFQAHPSVSILGGSFRTFKTTEDLLSQHALAGAQHYRMPCNPLLVRWHMIFSCSLAHPTVTFRKGEDLPPDSGPYPEGEEAEDHCCWLGLPLHVQLANLGDVMGYLRRHPDSRTSSAAKGIS